MEPAFGVRPKIAHCQPEKFALLLPDVAIAEACAITERLRSAFAQYWASTIEYPSGLQVTVSMGIASTSELGFSLPLLLKHADSALYQAKAEGRSRSVVAID